MSAQDFSFEVEAGEQISRESCRFCRHSQYQPGTTGSVRFLFDKNQCRRLLLDNTTEAEPRTQWDISHPRFRQAAKVHNNQTKAPALQQNVGNFKGLLQPSQSGLALAASHPQQSGKLNARTAGRIKRIACVHQRTEVLARGMGQQGTQHRGFARRSQIAATDFCQSM